AVADRAPALAECTHCSCARLALEPAHDRNADEDERNGSANPDGGREQMHRDEDGLHGDDASYIAAVPCPKIELHVHFEGTIRPATLLEIARRNDYALPADDVAGLAAL